MRVGDLLVPHDLGSLCDRALDLLHRMEVRPHRIHLLHVVPKGTDDARRALALAELRHRVEGGPWSRAEIHVTAGDPATRILALVEDVGVDLVALPSHGRSGLGRWVLGSVAETVARLARCLVLVVPAAQLAELPAPAPEPTDEEPTDHVERVAVRICDLVCSQGGRLSAVTVGLPAGEDTDRFEAALERRLLDAGIAFVDLSFRPWAGGEPEILVTRFEDGPLPLSSPP